MHVGMHACIYIPICITREASKDRTDYGPTWHAPPMLQLRRVREYWLTFVEEPCSASALQLGQAAGSGGGLRFRDLR